MSPLLHPLKYEVHIYWRGASMERITIKIGDDEHDLDWPITRIKREAVPHEIPHVEVQLIGRLVEHYDQPSGSGATA